MSYNKQTWVNGDIITADKLNHIEDGVESASNEVFIVSVLKNGSAVSDPSHTYAEMMEAYDSGKYLVCKLLMVPEQYGKQAEFLPLKSFYDSSNRFNFDETYIDSDHVKSYRVTCDSSNTWTYTTYNI